MASKVCGKTTSSDLFARDTITVRGSGGRGQLELQRLSILTGLQPVDTGP